MTKYRNEKTTTPEINLMVLFIKMLKRNPIFTPKKLYVFK